MIPLFAFLAVWFILIAIFALMAILTVYMNIKNGITTFGSYLTTAVFLGVTALVLLSVGGYLLTVDWSQTVTLLGGFSTVPLLQ